MRRFNQVKSFKIGFEDKCIRLFVEAYNQSVIDKSIRLDWNENDITGQLHEYIEVNPLRKKNPPVTTNVEHHLSNKSVEKVRGFTSKNSRIDLRFVTFNSEDECKVFFEAKNLKEKSYALKRRYIDTGIDNFITKKYPLGFLVGYLLEGAVNPTIDGVNYLLKNKKREKEYLYSKKHDIVQYYYVSYHSGLCLKHLIFDFTVL